MSDGVVRIEFNGSFELFLGCSPLPVEAIDITQCAVCFGQVIINFESLPCCGFCRSPRFYRWHDSYHCGTQLAVTISQPGIGLCVLWICTDRTFEITNRLMQVLFRSPVPEVDTLQVVVDGCAGDGSFSRQQSLLRWRDRNSYLTGDRP